MLLVKIQQKYEIKFKKSSKISEKELAFPEIFLYNFYKSFINSV